MVRRFLAAGAALASFVAAVGFFRARGAYRSWGIDPGEVTRELPGDELVSTAPATDTRGIDIAAPTDAVWPWLLQLGYGRGGWYSYARLDSDKPSASRILPEFQSLAVGDMVPVQMQPNGAFEVKVLDPGKALVLYADRAMMDSQRAGSGGTVATPDGRAAADDDFRVTWAFVLEPGTDGGTRLIERFRSSIVPSMRVGRAASRSMPGFAGDMLDFAWFVIARRQMLGIRDRAEGRPIKEPRAGRRATTLGRGAIPA